MTSSFHENAQGISAKLHSSSNNQAFQNVYNIMK